jgi:hypothetical protein
MYPDGASLAYKIDHVGACMPGAEEAFRFCHDRLALPVAWPFDYYGAARTGGIGLRRVLQAGLTVTRPDRTGVAG